MERVTRYGVKGFSSRFKAYLSINQLIPALANTVVAFDAVIYDSLNEFNIAVPIHEFVPLHAGYYLLLYQLNWITVAPASSIRANLAVNGGFGSRAWSEYTNSEGGWYTQTDTTIEHLNRGDRVNVIVWNNVGGGLMLQLGQNISFFCGHRLS